MSDIEKSGNDFIGYEYKEIQTDSDKISLCIDSYQSFGWFLDANIPIISKGQQTVMKLKRDRKILNKTELTRLQHHFEACMEEIRILENSKTKLAYSVALTIGIVGTAFMAGSTFAVTHQPPMVVLCILLAIPGFLGWITPYFVYKKMIADKTKKLVPMIEQKYDEIYEICEKGNKLQNRL